MVSFAAAVGTGAARRLMAASDSIGLRATLVVSHVVGKRSGDNARKLMRDISERLVFPNPHAADNHAFHVGAYQTVTQISTDMYLAYPTRFDVDRQPPLPSPLGRS